MYGLWYRLSCWSAAHWLISQLLALQLTSHRSRETCFDLAFHRRYPSHCTATRMTWILATCLPPAHSWRKLISAYCRLCNVSESALTLLGFGLSMGMVESLALQFWQVTDHLTFMVAIADGKVALFAQPFDQPESPGIGSSYMDCREQTWASFFEVSFVQEFSFRSLGVIYLEACCYLTSRLAEASMAQEAVESGRVSFLRILHACLAFELSRCRGLPGWDSCHFS